MDTQITVANDAQLNSALLSLEDQLEAAAIAEIDAAGMDLTIAERNSVIQVHKLKLLNSVDFATLMLRGKLMKVIEEQALWATHPGGYQTMEQMAEDQGISLSEYSDIRRLIDVVFPYMQRMGIEPAVVWQNLGKSKCRELSSIFSVIIDGTELEGTKSVNVSAQQLLDDLAASMAAAGIEYDNATLREAAVRQLVQMGEELPIREIRRTLRPETTPAIEANFVNANNRRYMIAELTDDQMDMLNRILGRHMDPITFDLPNDPVARANEAARIRPIRDLASLVVIN